MVWKQHRIHYQLYQNETYRKPIIFSMILHRQQSITQFHGIKSIHKREIKEKTTTLNLNASLNQVILFHINLVLIIYFEAVCCCVSFESEVVRYNNQIAKYEQKHCP